MDTLSKFFPPGIGFLVTIIFGLWMSRNGKPYNGILFNIHKLVALGTVIVTAIQVYKITTTLEPQALMFLWLVVAVISVVALFASGAFMSIGNTNHDVMKTIHNIALGVAVIAMGMTIYFLNGRTL